MCHRHSTVRSWVHEHQPLNAIQGWTGILARDSVTTAQKQAVEVIEGNVRAQVRIVDDLLDMSRVISESATHRRNLSHGLVQRRMVVP